MNQPIEKPSKHEPTLPIWWDDYLQLVEKTFRPNSDPKKVLKAKEEMTKAALSAINITNSFLKHIGLRQPGEQDPFEQWAKSRGYLLECVGPIYKSRRTKDAEFGWMARARLGSVTEKIQPTNADESGDPDGTG